MKASADRYNDYRLTGALTAAKAKDAKLVASLLDRAKLDFTGDEIGGLEEQLNGKQRKEFRTVRLHKGTGRIAMIGRPPAFFVTSLQFLP